MNNCEKCTDNRPRVGRLAGVTRTMRLAIYEGEGVPTGTPQDLSGLTVVVRVLRDGTTDIFTPGFVIEGESNNVVKFEWPAERQTVGDYTLDVTMTDGSGNINRVDWHGPHGIRLVAHSFQVYGEDAIGVESNEEVGLIGYFTSNGVGMSAYDEWIAQGHTGTEADFIAWLRQPADDAATDAQLTVDTKMAEVDAEMAAIAAQASSDHSRAGTDHGTAASDHTTAAADHLQAQSDHATAVVDSTNAGLDHTRAGEDHDVAAADHTQASSDHTQAASDHTTAAGDHTTAAADHTQAVADHAVMAGYDTRLDDVEDEVSQLGQKVDDLATGKYYGYFASASELPDDADVDGFAYVGSGPTYTVYNLRSGVWASSGITVNQSPIGNEEDIDQDSNGKLQFANRAYNLQTPDGMGYKILRKNASFASQVTDGNTIYEIRNNFDLGGLTVIVPDGSILRFNGGKLSHGELTGSFLVEADRVLIFDGVAIPQINGSVFPEWFGAFPDGVTDCSATMQTAMDAASTLVLGVGTYVCASPLQLGAGRGFIGESLGGSVLKCSGLRVTSVNNVENFTIMPYDANVAVLIDINSAYINRSYAVIRVSKIRVDCGTNTYGDLSIIRVKCDSTKAYAGFYDVKVDKIEHYRGRVGNVILLEANNSTTPNPWITGCVFTNIFSNGCKYCVKCVVSDASDGFIFMDCFFGNVRSQAAANYTLGFATLANMSQSIFDRCGNFDAGNIKPYNLQNTAITISVYNNLEGSVYSLLSSSESVPYENLLLDRVQAATASSLGSVPSPIRMLGITQGYDITGAAPNRPGIIPSYFAYASSYFRGFRITNYSGMSATRSDSLLGVDSSGYPVCAANKTGTNNFDVRPIYSDAYVPRAGAASMPTTGKVLGAMLFNTTAFVPLWFQPTYPGWFNADGIQFTNKVTAVRGATSVREALQLTSTNKGLRFYDETLKKYVLWNGSAWVDLDGTSLTKSGTTASRPTNDIVVGFQYFDTDLGKPIWYNGSGWVDATGATV